MSNLISARVTDEAVAAAKAKIVEINEQLPFLVALSAAQKKRRRVMGQKSVEYVNLALRGADHFGKYLPVNFNREEFERDVRLVSQLWDIRVPLAALLESLDDTIFAASTDAMARADEVYQFLKAAGRADAAVKAHVEEMRKRFIRRTEKPAPQPDNPTETP
ncbi:hypothetical protein [Tannerella forsythia]|uniref:Uncharacterized protein n=1 Tax=Tannerella forsythia TaxID=28112 RepID=A0A3P1YXL0_TANFO|nr:hypothetical protein [Tannerella forsythia]RRD73563.1 hypothetical protein EII41_09290 [Tannerella forsythia]